MAIIDQEITSQYALYNGDSCEVLPTLPAGSIHLSIYSPPFCGLYNYSSSARDLSNCRDYDEFFGHYEFLVKEIHRATMAGRFSAVHCMDVPNNGCNLGGGLTDFPGDIIRLHVGCQKKGCKASERLRANGKCGHGLFEYACRYDVWKEPLGVRNRTMAKGLAHKQIVDDSTLCDVASADYLLLFRKKGENPVPVSHPTGLMEYAGERQVPHELLRYRGWTGKQTENRYSHWIWRQYASAFWDDIRIDRVLPYKESRDPDDEKHCHPLQLDVIDRTVVLRSNPGEVVLTPFMGVGSEVYSPVTLGRRGVGIELKSTYYRQAAANVRAAAEGVPLEQELFGGLEESTEE